MRNPIYQKTILLWIVCLFVSAASPVFANCMSPSGTPGDILYNGDYAVMQYCDNTQWVAMGPVGNGSGSGPSCASPAGDVGDLLFNGDSAVMQYCNGTKWVAMGPAPSGWKQVAASYADTCGIKPDNSLWCWGYGGYGQLANGGNSDSAVPLAVSSGTSWKQVAMGVYRTCAIKSDDTLWCWGLNDVGQIGDNTTTNRSVPTQVNGGGSWKQVSTQSQSHTCAIKSDDTLWCWGDNSKGELGDNTTTQRKVPTAVNGGGTWKQVVAGNYATCAIKSDDTLWCWGLNDVGQLGNNSLVNKKVPTAVNGGYTWKQVALSTYYSACAIKSDDTLLCWGSNYRGELGDYGGGDHKVPTAIYGGGTWKQVTMSGDAHTCAIKSDNTLWCWGGENIGQLGDNTTNQQSIPTAIYGGGTWKQVSTGYGHTCAIKSDNLLWCTGVNDDHEFGDGTTTSTLVFVRTTPGCASPAGVAGSLIFNSSYAVLQYCNGDAWIGIGK